LPIDTTVPRWLLWAREIQALAQTGLAFTCGQYDRDRYQQLRTLGAQTLFRPEAKRKKVMADLYRVTSPDDPVLENGNKLCKGKPIAYLIVWKSEPVGKEADARTLAPFSGPKLSAGSPDDCGRYVYDAGSH
jgi:Hydrolase of X-linked nucleoside diphosphate N terminal